MTVFRLAVQFRGTWIHKKKTPPGPPGGIETAAGITPAPEETP
jgi:hypothetical protein